MLGAGVLALVHVHGLCSGSRSCLQAEALYRGFRWALRMGRSGLAQTVLAGVTTRGAQEFFLVRLFGVAAAQLR